MTDPIVQIPEIPPVPDFFGTKKRVKSVADLLESAQAQVVHLRAVMTLNQDAEDDPIAGSPPDKKVTYGERFKSLDDGIAALLAANTDIAQDLEDEAGRRRSES
jgi:hypothetical protein